MLVLVLVLCNLRFLSPSVLEAARQKTNAVPYLNRSTLFIGYGFYNYDIFIDPFFPLLKFATSLIVSLARGYKYKLKINKV